MSPPEGIQKSGDTIDRLDKFGLQECKDEYEGLSGLTFYLSESVLPFTSTQYFIRYLY